MMRKRIFAAFVCLCMMMALVPSMAYANDTVYTGGLCEHHTKHDDACGYTEGTAEIPCSHKHNESCGGLTDPAACNHSHDEACCYVPATEGTPCTFVCEVCNAQDSGNPATPSDAQPEECTCETLCTEEEINADCPVCSVEGAELDKVCVGVAPMLPVTALAAAPIGQVLYVGGVQISSTGYWTTDSDGNVIASTAGETPTDNYIHYDAENNVLTLHNATIKNELEFNESIEGGTFISGSAIGVFNKSGNAELTISLVGTNTIANVGKGIFVLASSASTGSSNLTIQGDGSLNASASQTGIWVQSNGNNAALCVENAEVTASPDGAVKNGVLVQAKDGSDVSLTVNGGSLTASVNANIWFQFGSGVSGSGTPTVTVSNNAIVRANGGIANTSSTSIQYGTGNKENGGIVWNGTGGTVYGDVELQEDLEIGEGESLTLDDGASLDAGNHNVIVDGGTLDENLANSLGDSVKYAPTITTHPKNVEVKEKETATFTVEATGSDLSYRWQQSTDNGSKWTNITGETNATYTIATTTMDMSGTQYRCVVKNSIDEVTSDAATLTVQKATTPIEPKYVRYIVEHYKQNADGSYTLADTEQPIDEIGKTVTATPKTYEGYTYNPNAAGTVVSGTLKAISSPDDIVTLKLYYDITLYTVTVNGSYAQTTGAGSYAKDATVTIDAGTRSGYTFDGWTSADGVTFADKNRTQTTFTMPDKAVTVTANWKKKSSGGSVFFWDLKFDTNGGSKIDTVTEWEYSTIDLDEYVPEKEGYKFVGWYADEDLTKKIDEVYLTQDTTVYAKWEKIEEEVSEEPEEVEETEETETISFLDVKESDWFYDAVFYAVENGLMSGMSEDIFAPNTSLTREMLAVVLYNVEGQPESTEANTFTDVKGDMWYTDAILWANANGIVAGYDNGAYGVGDFITREQFTTILYRYAQFKGYDTTQGGMAVREFSDYENISDYARTAMAWAVNAGIMGGMDDGTLMPQGKATRAEAATMLMNFCENVVK